MLDKVLKDDRTNIYEIGYLLVSSIPEEKVTSVVADLREVLTKKGASFIAEEAPELRTLAYTMAKKVGASNHKFDQGYFGWFKFELAVKDIAAIKKSFEENSHMLRVLIITTIKETTYLGKKSETAMVIKQEEAILAPVEVKEGAEVVASVDEMDKSIDAMVKEA